MASSRPALTTEQLEVQPGHVSENLHKNEKSKSPRDTVLCQSTCQTMYEALDSIPNFAKEQYNDIRNIHFLLAFKRQF